MPHLATEPVHPDQPSWARSRARDPSGDRKRENLDRRPLGVRMTPGLQAIESWTRQGRVWVLFDPIVGRYHRLLDEEYQLLRMLEVSSGFATLRTRFEAGDPRRRLDPNRFQQLLSQWYRDGLVESVWPDQATSLLAQRYRERRQRWWGALQNPLLIRLPGFDPRGLLRLVEPWMSWVLQPVGTGVIVATWLLVLGIFLTTWPLGWERMPAVHDLAAPRQWLVLLLTMGVVKVLHELGHGLACRLRGVEPKEMGVLLMLFTPFLYCDVTDAWRLPRARERIAISAAGIRVELLLAGFAGLGWWATQPGTIHQVCWVVMVLGSVNTLLVNGNPLLRYDGYYMLADALGITNLWQRSRRQVAEVVGKWSFAIPPVPRPDQDSRMVFPLLLYGIASMAYRWVVLLVVLWFVYQVLRPWGWGGLAVVVGLWMIAFAAGPACFRGYRRVSSEVARSARSRRRARATGSLVVLGVVIAFFIPLPSRMSASAIFRPAGAEEIFVTVGSELVEILARPGTTVPEGAGIARLRDKKLEIERLRLLGELRRAEAWQLHLEARGSTEPEARSRLPAAVAKRADLEGQLRELERDLKRLELTSTRAGRVWPVVRPKEPPSEDRLETWSGVPLEDSKLGAYFPAGTHVCSVGPDDQWQAFLYVDQDRIERLRPGLSVRLYPQHLPGVRLPGTILNLARVTAETVPPALADTLLAASGPAGTTPRIYQVQVSIDVPATDLLVEGRGSAVVWLDSLTAWEQGRRWLAATLAIW